MVKLIHFLVPSVYLVLEIVVFCESFKLGDRGVCRFTGTSVKKTEYKTVRYKCGKKTKGFCTKKVKFERVVESPPTTACCVGWEYSEVDGTCHPQCKNGCVNGECIAPDECYCAPPLTLNINYTCVQPECEHTCVNSFCSATNKCSCNDGYSQFNSTHCAPQCSEGYIIDDETLVCIPKCERPCINGTCEAPDTCRCMDGHKLMEDDKFTCVPDCKPTCENSDCIAPNICSCRKGYIRENDWKCKPTCDNCTDGDCVTPNVCKCHDGYRKVANDRCEPVCSQLCLNGTCSKPETCKCYEGYKIDEDDKFRCVPICQPACINATCSSTNTCSCLSGYEAENAWSCKPKCNECDNGDCIAPETCLCHKGFEFTDKCRPHCDRECTNGFCSEPNTCSCHIGYEHDSTDKFTCNPVCDTKCVNASCDSPNTCYCLPGYESVDNFTCKPKCNSCVNGLCVGPDQCQCHQGYQHTTGGCEPVCQEPCTNGNCSAPGVCTCHSGYLKNETNPSECYRPCEGPCEMGTCTTEGICICNVGFELENGTCVSAKPIECSICNTSCLESPCRCSDGRPCYVIPAELERSSPPGNLATITWVFAATLLVLLISLICIIQWMWRRRQRTLAKPPLENGQMYSSVVYTVPDTLMNRSGFTEDQVFEEQEEEDDLEPRPDVEEKRTTERLLTKEEDI